MHEAAKRLRDKRIKKINNGKIKGIGFFEGIKLRITGLLDGFRKLPKEAPDGRWNSPFINQELHCFDEFSSKMYGNLQVEEEHKYARISDLTKSLADTECQLASANKILEAAIALESTSKLIRRHGEDRLSDQQVEARRSNERAARLASYHNAVRQLEDKLATAKEEIAVISSEITEDNNTTRLICARVRDHLLQRLDLYWSAALRSHPDRARMPVIPDIPVESGAESLYMKPHTHQLSSGNPFKEELTLEDKEAA